MTAAGMGAQADKERRSGGGTILDRLADHARERVEEAKRRKSLTEIRQRASDMPKGNFAFENALKKSDIAFICECKKASPSKGLIAPEFPYLQIARERCIPEGNRRDSLHPLPEKRFHSGRIHDL